MIDFGKLESAIKGLAPHAWKGTKTVGGTKTDIASVEVVDCGLNIANQKAWIKARFTDESGAHTLMGKMRAAEAGGQGGADEITLDDTPVEKDDVVAGLQFGIFPPKATVVIAFKFGGGTRYEFKGDIPVGIALGL